MQDATRNIASNSPAAQLSHAATFGRKVSRPLTRFYRGVLEGLELWSKYGATSDYDKTRSKLAANRVVQPDVSKRPAE